MCVRVCVWVQHCFPVYGGGLQVQGVQGIMQVDGWVCVWVGGCNARLSFSSFSVYRLAGRRHISIGKHQNFLHSDSTISTLTSSYIPLDVISMRGHLVTYICACLSQAYSACLPNVALSGPTLLAPIIRAAAAAAEQAQCRSGF